MILCAICNGIETLIDAIIYGSIGLLYVKAIIGLEISNSILPMIYVEVADAVGVSKEPII